MLKSLMFGIGCVFAWNAVQSQSAPTYLLKAELTGALRKEINLGLEFGKKTNSQFELQVGFRPCNHRGYRIFEGKLITDYSMMQVDSFTGMVYYDYFLGRTDWTFAGTSRPLPEVPAVVPRSVAFIKFGFRSYLGNPDRRLRFFLQPNFSVSQYRYFNITDERQSISDNEIVQRFGLPQSMRRVVTEVVVYEQTRSMHTVADYYLGFGYDAGLILNLTKRWSLEARIKTGLNLSFTQKAAPDPNLVDKYYANFSIQVGYRIGRIQPKLAESIPKNL